MTNRTPGEADLRQDPKLGSALREALSMPHDRAFITRVTALVRQQGERSWDEVLSGWFWRGLAATGCAAALVATVWVASVPTATALNAEESVAVQLLEGDRPGSEVILASIVGIR